MKNKMIAMDIGGTFTDFVLYDEEKYYQTQKVLTTPSNLATGILNGIQKLKADLKEVNFCVQGTTAGLNALLERKGARVALITTESFRDVYEIGRGNRPDMYDIQFQKPVPLIKRRDVYEVSERILADGKVEKELIEGQVKELIRKLKTKEYESVAVTLLHSYINPEHEILIGDILKKELPDIKVSLSHEVAQEWREYERTSTTVLNAYVAPIVENYLENMEDDIASEGLEEQLHIMRSNGGVMTSEVAKNNPIQTLLSGPVGGAIGSNSLIENLETNNLICVDMGGTSFDVSMIIDGKPDVTNEVVLEGFPILTPMINIHTIGAGGGSIGWIEGGGLRVGPQSAGADPGPASYDKGGVDPTVTDANVILGRIIPEDFLGGDMQLNYKAAGKAVSKLGEKIGLNLEETAEGILNIANAKMADAIRQLTVRKGIDPREFTLVAFGGAGPMQAVFLAKELEIGQVLVPNNAGTFSAWGMLQADIRHDEVQTFAQAVDETALKEIIDVYNNLKNSVEKILTKQNITEGQKKYRYTVDMRYIGQEHTINIVYPDQEDGKDVLDILKEKFHDSHLKIYGHNSPEDPVEIVNLRITGIGELPKKGDPRVELNNKNLNLTPEKTTSVVFDGVNYDTKVFKRDKLGYNKIISGPAIVEDINSTTVIPPYCEFYIDEKKAIVIKVLNEEA